MTPSPCCTLQNAIQTQKSASHVSLTKYPEMESWCQQNIKLHMAYPKKLKYLTSKDPQGSRSLTNIYEVKNLDNAAR